jgi:hypothetical protein
MLAGGAATGRAAAFVRTSGGFGMWRHSAGRAAVLLVVLIVGACGGEAPAPSAAVGVDQAFRDRALAVCQDAVTSQKAWAPFPAGTFDPAKPDAAKLAVVASWLATEVAPTFDTWRDGLVALGPPAAGADAWASVIAEAKVTATFNDAQIAAASAADPVAFAKATADLRASHARLATAAGLAGVPACAAMFAD